MRTLHQPKSVVSTRGFEIPKSAPTVPRIRTRGDSSLRALRLN
jgi:hypothetical protein